MSIPALRELLDLRPDVVVRGYWAQVTVIEEDAVWFPVERIEEVDDVSDVWNEAGHRTYQHRQTLLDVPELGVSERRAA